MYRSRFFNRRRLQHSVTIDCYNSYSEQQQQQQHNFGSRQSPIGITPKSRNAFTSFTTTAATSTPRTTQSSIAEVDDLSSALKELDKLSADLKAYQDELIVSKNLGGTYSLHSCKTTDLSHDSSFSTNYATKGSSSTNTIIIPAIPPLPPNPVPPLLTGSTGSLYDNCCYEQSDNKQQQQQQQQQQNNDGDHNHPRRKKSIVDQCSQTDVDESADMPLISTPASVSTEDFTHEFDMESQFSLMPVGLEDSPTFSRPTLAGGIKPSSSCSGPTYRCDGLKSVFESADNSFSPVVDINNNYNSRPSKKSVSFSDHCVLPPPEGIVVNAVIAANDKEPTGFDKNQQQTSLDSSMTATTTAIKKENKDCSSKMPLTVTANGNNSTELLINIPPIEPSPPLTTNGSHVECDNNDLHINVKVAVNVLRERQSPRDSIVLRYIDAFTSKSRPVSYPQSEWEEPKDPVEDNIDRYGFIHEMRLPENYTEEEARLVKKQAEREHKWKKMVARWDKVPRAKLQSRTYKGIPEAFRAPAWAKLLGLDDMRKRHAGTFEKMLNYGLVHSRHVRQMDIDINRTFRNNVMFRERYGVKQRQLFHVLVAFSVYNPEVGYCQGMSTLAGFLLMYLDNEEDCFLALIVLFTGREVDGVRLSKYRMHGFYIDGFPKFQRFRDHHAVLVKRYLPRLHKHFEKIGFKPEIYLLKWLLDVFIGGIPVSLLLRIWDIFLLEGERILAAFAFCIIKMHEKRLLKQRQMEDLMGYFHGLANNFGAPDDVVIQCLQTTMDDLIRDKMLLPFQPSKLKAGPPVTELPRVRLGVLPIEGAVATADRTMFEDVGVYKCSTPVMEDVVTVSSSTTTAVVKSKPAKTVVLDTQSSVAVLDYSQNSDHGSYQKHYQVQNTSTSSGDRSQSVYETSTDTVQVVQLPTTTDSKITVVTKERFIEERVSKQDDSPIRQNINNKNNYPAVSHVEDSSPISSSAASSVSRTPERPHYQKQHQQYQQQHQFNNSITETVPVVQQPVVRQQQQQQQQPQSQPQIVNNAAAVPIVSTSRAYEPVLEEEPLVIDYNPTYESSPTYINNSSNSSQQQNYHIADFRSPPPVPPSYNSPHSSHDYNGSYNNSPAHASTQVTFQPLKSVSETLSSAARSSPSNSSGVDTAFSLAFAQAKMQQDLREAEKRRQRHQQARAEFFRAMLASGSLYSRGSADYDADPAIAAATGDNGHLSDACQQLENQPSFTVIPVIDESPTHSSQQLYQHPTAVTEQETVRNVVVVPESNNNNEVVGGGNSGSGNNSRRQSESRARRNSNSRRSSKNPSNSSSFVVSPPPTTGNDVPVEQAIVDSVINNVIAGAAGDFMGDDAVIVDYDNDYNEQQQQRFYEQQQQILQQQQIAMRVAYDTEAVSSHPNKTTSADSFQQVNQSSSMSIDHGESPTLEEEGESSSPSHHHHYQQHHQKMPSSSSGQFASRSSHSDV